MAGAVRARGWRIAADQGGTSKEQHHGRHHCESSANSDAGLPENGWERARHGGDTPHLRVRPGAGHLPGPVLPTLRRPDGGRSRGATPALHSWLEPVSEPAPAFALLAGLAAVACTVPYLRDTLRRTTVPHRGSWLIWGVLEVVAVEAQRADGARWSLVPLVTQCVGTCLVFGLSVRLGSGGLSRVDLALLGLAGVGLAGWQAVDAPVVATAFVIAADLVAAVMMLPKTCRDPHSETLSTFVLAAVSGALAVGAVGHLSAPLLMYPVYFVAVNAALAAVIVLRRKVLGRRIAIPGGRRVPRAMAVR